MNRRSREINWLAILFDESPCFFDESGKATYLVLTFLTFQAFDYLWATKSINHHHESKGPVVLYCDIYFNEFYYRKGDE